LIGSVRDTFIVVSGSDRDDRYATALASRLEDLGFLAWLLARDVQIGTSTVGEIDRQLRRARGLIFCMTATITPDEWSQRQLRAFQAITSTSNNLLLIIVSQDRSLSALPMAKSNAIVLPASMEPTRAAKMCATALRFASESPGCDSAESPRSGAVSSGAWSLVPDLDATYTVYAANIQSLVGLREYDVANELYWHTLMYSGYRERWQERLEISHALLRLSISKGDHVVAGLILSKGIAYTHRDPPVFQRNSRASLRLQAFRDRI
jgi:hypothetical protein